MSKAQTDIRTTSYDANTANAVGYQGSLDDALAQIRQELDIAAPNKARAELLHYLGVDKHVADLSGLQSLPGSYAKRWRPENTQPEDDSVEYYDADDRLLKALAAPSKYSLEFAISQGWVTRVQS